MKFCKLSPCDNCPYRTDAPIRLWHKDEFLKVLNSEQTSFGKVFQCHKKDDHVCVGYLMKQDERGFPNINIRILLSKYNVTREYLDRIFCKVPLYPTTISMIRANFPELLKLTHMLIKLKGKIITNEVWLNGKKLSLKRSLQVVNKSPTGFSWGYGGSGPAQLAAAICLELYGKQDFKKSLYQDFRADHIDNLPQTDFETEIEVDLSQYI